MTVAYVLLTAMPPTTGHKALIEYAAIVADTVKVIVCTQPGEPYVAGRVSSLTRAFKDKNVTILNKHQPLPQEPSGFPGFWAMWGGFLTEYGFERGDYIIASEDYGVRLAQEVGGVFIPFDLNRSIVNSRATNVRENPYLFFKNILPEFRTYLKSNITIFGAESTGKTTLAKELSKTLPMSQFYPEWARPYLETVGPEVTEEKMLDIWDGQRALQVFASNNTDSMLSFQDTDLFSTVGYWRNWDRESYPQFDIENDARALVSDLYIVTPSNIPFEKDQLRYGGDERETTDDYWISLLEEFDCNYVVLDSDSLSERVEQATEAVTAIMVSSENNPLAYTRLGQ